MGVCVNQASGKDKDGRGSGPGGRQPPERFGGGKKAIVKEVDEMKPVSHLFISALLHPAIKTAATPSATPLTTETRASKPSTCEGDISLRCLA